MSKQRYEKQLGMPLSTAKSQLDRNIRFALLCRLGLNSCHRCEQPMTVDNFSNEHKVEWIDSENPQELYFDLDNVTFSHVECNRANRRYYTGPPSNKGKITHGTSGYRLGCRCNKCKTTYSEARKERYRRLKT